MSNKPYVYARAEQLGIPIRDAKGYLKITVTADDVINARKANSKHCALARAALRLPDVNAAYFFRGTAFLEYGDKMVKYHLPESVSREIVSFDRAKIFAPGVYQMRPKSPSLSVKAVKDRAKQQRNDRLQGALKGRGGSLWAADAAKTGPSPAANKHDGGRTVSGIRRADAPQPLPANSPAKRYVHRTQYIRDLKEPRP